MAQPKNPPLSVRLPQKVLDALKADAEARGIPLNRALVRVLEESYSLGEAIASAEAVTGKRIALDPRPDPPSKPEAKPAARRTDSLGIAIGFQHAAPGSRLKKK